MALTRHRKVEPLVAGSARRVVPARRGRKHHTTPRQVCSFFFANAPDCSCFWCSQAQCAQHRRKQPQSTLIRGKSAASRAKAGGVSFAPPSRTHHARAPSSAEWKVPRYFPAKYTLNPNCFSPDRYAVTRTPKNFFACCLAIAFRFSSLVSGFSTRGGSAGFARVSAGFPGSGKLSSVIPCSRATSSLRRSESTSRRQQPNQRSENIVSAKEPRKQTKMFIMPQAANSERA